ncbi:MAG: hypothetical protein ACE5Z5_01190 [Candidatus Bathyarchaeia archaeon]
MSKITENEERDAIDHITNTMFSVAFLMEISDFIFSPLANSLTVGQFYNQWIRRVVPDQIKIPFSPGIILGELYVAIVYGKEMWFDIIPDVEVNKLHPECELSVS